MSAPAKVPVSVLIPTMNRPKSLDRTLNTYVSGSCIPTQIVVVDQTKDEQLRAEVLSVVEKYQTQTNVELVRLEEPSSTKARNVAMSYARDETLIFSDDDVDVQKDTIENVKNILSDSKIAMIAGLDSRRYEQKLTLREKIVSFGQKISRRKGGWVSCITAGCYQKERVTQPLPTQWSWGFFFVVRKSLLDRYGVRWDENLIRYAFAEDLDFSYSYYKKAREEGLLCILHPDIVVTHMVSSEYRAPGKLWWLFFVVNRAYLAYKHQFGICKKLVISLWNWNLLFQLYVTRRNPGNLWRAIRYCSRHKKAIRQGNLFNHADFENFV